MPVRLTWDDTNFSPSNEDELRVYNSAFSIDVNSPPTPLAVLPADTVEYLDARPDAEGFYRVSAVLGGFEAFSDEVQIGTVTPPSSANQIASTTFALNTTVGNQVITIPELSGAVPKLVHFVVTPNDTSGVLRTNVALTSEGVSDGVSSCAMYAAFENNAGSGTNTPIRDSTLSSCIFGFDGLATFSASFVSFNSGGFTINIDIPPSASYNCIATVYSGDDLQVSLTPTTTVLATGTNILTGFEPELVYAFSHNGDLGESVFHFFSRGWSHNQGGGIITEQCVGLSDNGSTRTRNNLGIQDLTYMVDSSNFNSGGFTVTSNAASSNGDLWCFVSLSWSGNADIALGTHVTSSSTGIESVTGLGFNPTNVIMFPTIVTMSNTPDIGSGFAFLDASNQASSYTSSNADSAPLSSGFFDGSITLVNPNTNVVDLEITGSLVADGFDLDLITNATALDENIQYLAIRV